MDLALSRIEPGDTVGIDHAHRVIVEAFRADVPGFPPETRNGFHATFTHPWPGRRSERVLAHADGEPVGYLGVDLPLLDNTDNVFAEVFVHPAHRRRGVGRALHGYAARLGRDAGRKRLMGFTVAGLPGGPVRDGAGGAFAVALGADSVLDEVRRRLSVPDLDQNALDGLLAGAWPKADGYTLVRWRDGAPDEYLDDIAYLDGRLLEDAPMGDLAMEPERVDAARVRATEAASTARGRHFYHCGLLHDATGRLVAWTTLAMNREVHDHALQHITIVEPRHRGHRLGLIAKIENLRYALAHEPELRHIDTWNAANNAHMISINEAIGFRPVDAWHNWQRTLRDGSGMMAA